MSSKALSARDSSGQRRLARMRRHRRVRRRVGGNSERPRLVVFRSARHIYAQVVDDTSHKTLASASSLAGAKGNKSDIAKSVGLQVAANAKAAGVEQVTFDRGGYAFHGRVASLAGGAREGGLQF